MWIKIIQTDQDGLLMADTNFVRSLEPNMNDQPLHGNHPLISVLVGLQEYQLTFGISGCWFFGSSSDQFWHQLLQILCQFCTDKTQFPSLMRTALRKFQFHNFLLYRQTCLSMSYGQLNYVLHSYILFIQNSQSGISFDFPTFLHSLSHC